LSIYRCLKGKLLEIDDAKHTVRLKLERQAKNSWAPKNRRLTLKYNAKRLHTAALLEMLGKEVELILQDEIIINVKKPGEVVV